MTVTDTFNTDTVIYIIDVATATADARNLIDNDNPFAANATRAEQVTAAKKRVKDDQSLRYRNRTVKANILVQLCSEEPGEQGEGLMEFRSVVLYTTVNTLAEQLDDRGITANDMGKLKGSLFTYEELGITEQQKWAMSQALMIIAGEPNQFVKKAIADMEISTEATTLLTPPVRTTKYTERVAAITGSEWFERFEAFIKANDQSYRNTPPEKRKPSDRELGWMLEAIANPTNSTVHRLEQAERYFFQVTSRWEKNAEQAAAQARKQQAKVADLQERIAAVRDSVYYPELRGRLFDGNTHRYLQDVIDNPGNWEDGGSDEDLLRRALSRCEKQLGEIEPYVDQLIIELPLAIWFGVDEEWTRHLGISRRASEFLSEISVIPTDEARREFLLTPKGEDKLSRRYICRTALDELFSSYYEFSEQANPYRLIKPGSEPFFEEAESARLMRKVFERLEQERIAAEKRMARKPVPTSMPDGVLVYTSEATESETDGEGEGEADNDPTDTHPEAIDPALLETQAASKPGRKGKGKGDTSRRSNRRRRGPSSQTWQERDAGESFAGNKPNPQGPDADRASRGSAVAHAGLGQKERAARGIKK
jgi:hypothetical protein